MNYWVSDFSSKRNLATLKPLIGGKAYHLALMQQWKLPVPVFGVVTTHSFLFWKKTGKLPLRLLEEIRLFFTGVEFVAVRSSMSAEDGDQASFAGIMESFLSVALDQIEEKIIECFQSLYQDRVTAYQKIKNQGTAAQLAAVVIQEMFPSTSSGVAFSRNPLGNSALVYVDAGYGLGEGIVAGTVEVDHFWFDRFGNEIRRKINPKKTAIQYVELECKTMSVNVPQTKQNIPCTDDSTLFELVKLVLLLEQLKGIPVDVEWGVADARIALLQVRAITQKFPELGYYIDTNLSESYPGLTSPMTAQYVQKMYTMVFRETAGLIGFSRSRMNFLQPHFDNLISTFAGHLYYNLNSYYTVIASLPGNKKNLDTWHRMIGGALPAHGKLKIPALSCIDNLKIAFSLGKILLNRKKVYAQFHSDFKKRETTLFATLNTLKTARETIHYLHSQINNTKGAGLTALNDLFLMNGLKILSKILASEGVDPNTVAAALKTGNEVESVKPLARINELRQLIENKAGFIAAIDGISSDLTYGLTYEKLREKLSRLGFEKESQWITRFINDFGDRAFEELKLECPTFSQSPVNFLTLIRWLLLPDALNDTGATRIRQKQAHNPNAIPWPEISWHKRKMALFFQKFTQDTIAVREDLRLLRGRYYGWVRSTLQIIFEQLVREKIIHCTWMEFFGLTLADLYAFSSGAIDSITLNARLEKNRNWHENRMSYPECFAHPLENNKPVDEKPVFLSGEPSVSPVSSPLMFQGVGVSPGIIQGKAMVLLDPREAFRFSNIKDYILVTQSTDPAWIFIMSQCKGLISEKGSLLSHTAIIGRELGIPTVVGIPQIARTLKSEEPIEIDGAKGTVKKLLKS